MWFESCSLSPGEIPKDFEELKRSFGTILQKASLLVKEKKKTKIIIFLDALNQLDNEGFL